MNKALLVLGVLSAAIAISPVAVAVDRELPAFADAPDPQTHPWLKEQLLKRRYPCPAGSSQFTGPPDAPIKITEFVDYLCPYCQEEETTIKKVLAKYPGQIKLIVKYHPLEEHKGALSRAKVAQAMAAQGKFWQAHEQFLHGANSDGVMKEADKSKLKEYWDGGGDGQVDADLQLAKKLGLNITPSFVIDGIRIGGPIGEGAFKGLIDYELARKHSQEKDEKED